MFDELGDGVFRRRFESLDLNVGIVIGSEGVLVLDTRASSRQARELLGELDRLTHKPVRWVINTHWHWDHVMGNSVFDQAEIIGHETCRQVLIERAHETIKAAMAWMPPEESDEIARTEVVPPSRVFADSMSMDIGRVLKLDHFGRGHTDADILVTVLDAGVVFMGDLIEEGAPPAFGDSYPLEWPNTLQQASGGSEQVIVPGHGDVVGPSYVASQISELQEVSEIAKRLVAADIGLDEAVSSGPYPVDVMTTAMARATEGGG